MGDWTGFSQCVPCPLSRRHPYHLPVHGGLLPSLQSRAVQNRSGSRAGRAGGDWESVLYAREPGGGSLFSGIRPTGWTCGAEGWGEIFPCAGGRESTSDAAAICKKAVPARECMTGNSPSGQGRKKFGRNPNGTWAGYRGHAIDSRLPLTPERAADTLPYRFLWERTIWMPGRTRRPVLFTNGSSGGLNRNRGSGREKVPCVVREHALI